MMQTFLINLDRVPERLALMEERFAAHGATFERVPAVDARLLSDADIARHVDGIGYWGRLSRSEVACFLSHRLCWQRIADRDLPYALVLEDDVRLGEDVGELLAQIHWIPEDADLVKLETSLKPVWLDRSVAARVASRSVTRLYSSHDCTAAYVVSLATARRLLRETERFRDEVDELLFTERSALSRSLTIYQMDPAPFAQEWNLGDVDGVPGLESTLKDRDGKLSPTRSVPRRLRNMVGQGLRDLNQAVMEFLGRRHTTVVAFR
jgi:glycosyl transferase family 25